MKHFILCHQFVPPDDEVRFEDEMKLAQDVFGPLGAFDLNGSSGVTELDEHVASYASMPNRSKDGRKAARARLDAGASLIPPAKPD